MTCSEPNELCLVGVQSEPVRRHPVPHRLNDAQWLYLPSSHVLIEGVVSGWERVRSGVPQGSVLAPVLFVIFIDDIDANIRSTMLKFADDTKLVARVGSEEDKEVLIGDLIGLCGWSQDWQMLFNLDKCAVMHFGFSNIGDNVELGGKILASHTNEIDIGVTVQSWE